MGSIGTIFQSHSAKNSCQDLTQDLTSWSLQDLSKIIFKILARSLDKYFIFRQDHAFISGMFLSDVQQAACMYCKMGSIGTIFQSQCYLWVSNVYTINFPEKIYSCICSWDTVLYIFCTKKILGCGFLLYAFLNPTVPSHPLLGVN